MNKTIIAGAAALAIAGAAYLTLDGPPADKSPAPAAGDPLAVVTLPATLSEKARIGKTAFDAVCAACHGTNAAGRNGEGPPLVHKIYEPSHHGDMAFFMAAEQGVRSHHWSFGNMPAQTGLTKGDIGGIVAYIRELQRANGIN